RRFLDSGLDFRLERSEARLVGNATPDEFGAKTQERIAGAALLDFLLGAVGGTNEAALALDMAVKAVGARLDQGRAVARPRPRHRLLGCLPDRDDVVAVNGEAGNAKGDAAVGDRAGDHRRGR